MWLLLVCLPDVSYETDQDLKNILGHVAYVLEGMKQLFEVKSYHMKVTSDELTVENDFIYGMITNSRSVGGFKNLPKNVDMNDGLFEVTDHNRRIRWNCRRS